MKNEIIAAIGFILFECGVYHFSPALSVIFLGVAIMLLGVVNASPQKGQK